MINPGSTRAHPLFPPDVAKERAFTTEVFDALRWALLASALALVAIGASWLIAKGHVRLVAGLAVGVAAMVFAVRAPGPTAALLVLAIVNAVPIVNLGGRLPGGVHLQDIAVIALMAFLFVRRGASRNAHERRLTRAATIWGALFIGWWTFTFARSVLLDGVPALKALLFGRDFLYFGILLPLVVRVRIPARSVRQGAIVLISGVVLYDAGQVFGNLTGRILPYIVHPIATSAVGGITRVFSLVGYVGHTCLILVAAVVLTRHGSRRRLLLAGVALLLVAALTLQLTRASYVALVIALLAGIAVYAWRYGSASRVLVRGLMVVLAGAVVVIPLSGSVGGGSGGGVANALISRVSNGVSNLSSSSGTFGYRERVDSTMVQILGSRWPVGLGFLHPSARYFPALPQGSIRNGDTGVVNELMTMGLIGVILLYAPLLYAARELVRVRKEPDSSGTDVPRWVVYGGVAWIAWAITGSATLVLLFSVPGLVVTALLLGLFAQTTAVPNGSPQTVGVTDQSTQVIAPDRLTGVVQASHGRSGAERASRADTLPRRAPQHLPLQNAAVHNRVSQHTHMQKRSEQPSLKQDSGEQPQPQVPERRSQAQSSSELPFRSQAQTRSTAVLRDALTIDLSAYDTDKSPAYLKRYQTEFGHLFKEPVKLLELGVKRCGSLYLWRDLMPYAQIAGLDVDRIDLKDDSGRVHLYQGFQQDRVVLDRIAADVAPEGFDVIVDDASHLGKYTAVSFWHLFSRHLKPGGVYAIDDWGCGYWNHWADGHAYTGSREALGEFSSRADIAAGVRPRGLVGEVRRRARASVRPIADKLPVPALERLRQLDRRMEVESSRFPSHDYGMVGFIKQLVDACAIRDIDRGGVPFENHIASVHVYESQVFVHKQSAA